MRRLSCFLALMLVLAALLAVCVSAGLQGNANYKYELSEDGKTATVTVSLSGYPNANSMMIIPDYDETALNLKRGVWLVDGEIAINWSKDTNDAVIAFDEATNINVDIFKFTFEVKDKNALNNVSCNVIAKAIEPTTPPVVNPPETNPPETNPPETNPPETNPPETNPPETNPPETNPPETNPPETNPPETNPPETNPPETNPPETNPPETNPPETNPPETNPPETNPPETDSPNSGYYPYEQAPEKPKGGLLDGYLWTVVLVACVAAAGIAAVVIGVIRTKRR